MRHLKLYEDYNAEKWFRKPVKWTDIDPEENYVDYADVQDLPHYEDWELWPIDRNKNEESNPLDYFENKPKEDIFVVLVDGEQEFLVDLSGANYVRLAKIVVGGPAKTFENEINEDFLGDKGKPYVEDLLKQLSFGDKLTGYEHGFFHGNARITGRELGKELKQKFQILGTDRGRSTDYYIGWEENDIVYAVQRESDNYIQIHAFQSKEDWNKDKPYGKYKKWE